mmetsp:Transcript_21050/g.58420  ORF Transcript_21050/g.58420 Transcript_21050/m.58420 type:complete len:98 (-) Transcript_21050:834-1127(-)
MALLASVGTSHRACVGLSGIPRRATCRACVPVRPARRRAMAKPLHGPPARSWVCQASAELADPSPELDPKQVVQAQLTALQEKDSNQLLKFVTKDGR